MRTDALLDDNHGRVSQHVQVHYENDFLSDFLKAQIDDSQSAAKGGVFQSSSGLTKDNNYNAGSSSRVPDIVYQQY